MEIPIFDTKFGQKLLIGLKIWSTLQILVRNLVKNSNFGWKFGWKFIIRLKIWSKMPSLVGNLVVNSNFG